ncbi:MAG TPA: TetR/AcrR family transcriptional regulator [Gemmatimonadales bacterium]|nr:TetR/AcrR family transcriptional regulator [Gemmatimonadales bacterium]
MPAPATAALPSPRVRAKRRRRRQEILRAALEAFRDQGYHATTLDDIAARIGVRKTALYHYFPDKESILYACHRESLLEVERLIAEAHSRYGTAADRLAHVIREHVRVMTDTLQGSPFAFDVRVLSAARQRRVIAARDAYERRLRQIIQDGIRSGEFTPRSPKIAVFAILGAINWIARWYRPGGPVSGAELGRQFAEQLVGGLTCRKPR